MKTEDRDEPEWAGIGWTIFSIIVYVIVFGIIIPGFLGIVSNKLWFELRDTDLSPWISYGAVGFVISMLVLDSLLKSKQHVFRVDPGSVQFVQIMIPGFNFALKLDGGFHIVLPIFAKWKEAWKYDIRWDFEVEKYRVSACGYDLIVSALGTTKPARHHLLPLHLLGDETDSGSTGRKTVVTKNIKGIVQKVLEYVISKRTAESAKNNPSNPIDMIDEVIGDVISIGIDVYRELEKHPTIEQYGVLVDTFSVGDMDSPDVVNIARDKANGIEVMMENARTTAANTSKVDPTVTPQFVFRASQLASGHISEATTSDTSNVGRETINGIGGIVLQLAQLVLGHKSTSAPVQQSLPGQASTLPSSTPPTQP